MPDESPSAVAVDAFGASRIPERDHTPGARDRMEKPQQNYNNAVDSNGRP